MRARGSWLTDWLPGVAAGAVTAGMALLLAARASFDAGRAPRRSLEEEESMIIQAEQLAASCHGTPAKSARVVKSMTNKWTQFLVEHGEAFGFDESVGPTVELACRFAIV